MAFVNSNKLYTLANIKLSKLISFAVFFLQFISVSLFILDPLLDDQMWKANEDLCYCNLFYFVESIISILTLQSYSLHLG